MATLTIRGLPEQTRLALKLRAASHNRSMEAEARSILEAAVVSQPNFMVEWIRATETLRGDFEEPRRSAPREVELQ